MLATAGVAAPLAAQDADGSDAAGAEDSAAPPSEAEGDARVDGAEAVRERDAEARREAVELAAEARASYEQGDALGAILAYEQAFDLAPDPAFAFNLGALYDAIGETPRARLYLAAYLELYPDAPNAAQVTELIAELDRTLELGYGRVDVTVFPADASVLEVRSGRGYFLGSAPLSSYFDPGTVTLRVERPAWRTRTVVLQLDEGSRTEIHVALAPQSYRLRRAARFCAAGMELPACDELSE